MWIWLVAAILSEVGATLTLKATDGFTRLGPGLLVVAGYSFAFFALSRALARGMPVGTAYAIWAAVGIALIAVLGVFIYGERLTLIQSGGLALVLVGVIAIELGASSA